MLITQREVARRLTLSVRSLERWRVSGTGPRYVRLSRGRIAYRIEDVDAWVASKVVRSTSEENR
jgi:predicted DNA-binding transcriptional regulator AlpA